MTATRVNAIFDIGIALALGFIVGACAVLVMQGCESEPEAGGCGCDGGLVHSPSLVIALLADVLGQDVGVMVPSSGTIPLACPASGLDETMGGCGVTLDTRSTLSGHLQVGQPPILQALAPAGSKAGTCFGVEPPSVVGDGPSGLRFEEGNSGRGETRTLQGKQANASADLLAWTSTEADRYPPSVRRALDLLVAHESVGGTRMVGDGGAAQGWLQQHRGHWQDGCKRLGVSWPWPADTRDRAKCERVAVACWERFAAAYMDDVDELIRRHRLPMDPYRADNAVYLAKVKAIERSGR